MSELVQVGGVMFFVAHDGPSGSELWKSDGTEAGTVLVKDINPDPTAAGPDSLIHVNGTLFFSANDGVSGRELWKSDGTEAGTVRVKDLFPGAEGSLYDYGSSNTRNWLAAVNGTLFFTANDGVSGYELWKSDGTEAGTVLVKELDPTDSVLTYFSTDPDWLTELNGAVIFVAGSKLWRSDGTEAGTVSIGVASALVYRAKVGTSLFYTVRGDNRLWKTDGTSEGTFPLQSFATNGAPAWLGAVGETLYFSASDGVSGHELWKSDGTTAGTVLVRDIRPGAEGSFPRNFTGMNGQFFFSASDGTTAEELWKSDGTAAGTVLVRDISFGGGNAAPSQLTPVNGTLFFTATNAAAGQELWKSDGTTAGTTLVLDIRPGNASSAPTWLQAFNGTAPLHRRGRSEARAVEERWHRRGDHPPQEHPASQRGRDAPVHDDHRRKRLLRGRR
jgi:ELWxxDGT repeat protein